MSKQYDGYAYPPRGLSRIEAARYVGVSPSTFDKWVASRHMPKPNRVGGRVIWDRFAIDAAFSDLPGDENEIDKILRGGKGNSEGDECPPGFNALDWADGMLVPKGRD